MPYARLKNELPLIPGYASGDIVTIEAAAAPLNKCVVDILPVQAGTGDPSPTNIRAISGWSSVNVTVNDGQTPPVIENVTNIPLGSTYYGGTLDVVSGVLTVTHRYMICSKDNQNWNKSNYYDGSFFVYASTIGLKNSNPFICSHLATLNSSTGYAYGKCFADSALNLWIMESGSSLDDFKNYLDSQIANGTPVTICGELAEPITIQLTPQEVNTILGQNKIFADSGDIDIIYIRRNDS